ncbi:MAG: ATP synthase subunit I [Bryobacterales bacterium]|nr:ATP synthase subunit I [Bryobacterales bacterium]
MTSNAPDPALRRTFRLALWVGLAGMAAAWIWGGWQAGLGFAMGAGASAFNLHVLHRAVAGLGAVAEGGPAPTGYAMAAGLRYLLIAAGAYVIVKYSPFTLGAALAGLFVPVAAILLATLYELFYGTTS